MPNESRLLGKQILAADGFATRPDLSGPAIFIEGGNIVNTAPTKLGDSNAAVTMWTTTASVAFGAIAVTGTGAAVAVADAAMSGIAVGDWVQAAPIVSFPDKVFWQAACYSAGAVHIKGMQNGSGAFTPDNITFRIMAIKVA